MTKEAINELKKYTAKKKNTEKVEISVLALNRLISALEEQEPRWIPVSERLPEDGERVLATHLGGLNSYKQVIEHIYVNGKFTMGWDMDTNVDSPTVGQRYMGKVIAWMPLPEPYKAESEEKK